jgi:protein-arginine kinase activator protein McsA
VFEELDTFFSEIKPLFYKVGPNGYLYYYKNSKPEESSSKVEDLKTKLNESVVNQDFETAVKLRDMIKSLEENGEKLSELEMDLKKSIEEENFESSIEIRDRIKELSN